MDTVVPFQRALGLDQFDPAKVGIEEIPKPDPALLVIRGEVAELPRISVASGEAFLASDILRSELHDVTGCGAIDMNLLGLTVATSAHAIPSLHLRVVSDDADDGAGEAFITFINAYKGEGGRIIAKVIKDMPEDPTAPSSYPNLRKLLDRHQN